MPWPRIPAKSPRRSRTAWTAKVEEILEGCMMVKAGSVELLIWSPAAYQSEYKALEVMAPTELPAVVGATIAIERARPLQALLGANNVSFALGEGDRVLVAPEQAGGLMLEFMPQISALAGPRASRPASCPCWERATAAE